MRHLIKNPIEFLFWTLVLNISLTIVVLGTLLLHNQLLMDYVELRLTQMVEEAVMGEGAMYLENKDLQERLVGTVYYL